MIPKSVKEQFLNQKAVVIWMTGLSGSGKTTLAKNLQNELFRRGYLSQILDGDKIRSGININLGYSETDRIENIRRTAEISKLFLNCGIICINSFITPANEMRQIAKNIIGKENLIEIYMSASLEYCEKLDIKGFYKDARDGKIKNFTGIDAPYEIPVNPEIEINSEFLTIKESVQKCMEVIRNRIKY